MESAARLNWLDNEIHLLDHRRSEAEKRLAKIEERKYRFSDPEDKSDEMPGAKELVMEMERLHDNYEEQMGELKDRVLNSLDNPIRQIEINRSAGVTEQ